MLSARKNNDSTIPAVESFVELSLIVVQPSPSFTILDVVVVMVNVFSSVQVEVVPVEVNAVFIAC
jgi:hypothetical protein